MRAYVLPSGCRSVSEMKIVEKPSASPGPGELLIRVRAASLNYRDQAIITGNYFTGPVSRDTVPLSDGAGEVITTGPGVTRFKSGDRVAGTFFQNGATLGSPLDGMLAEEVVLQEGGVVHIPHSLSFEQGATLPCAAVTAWNALFCTGRPVKPGDTVLLQGTGGVSIFGLQFSRAAGARVILTSSSDDKLERAKAMGAWGLINYKTNPAWDQEVLKLTGGRGVDCVVEVGGAGTLGRSLQSIATHGKIALIGVLTGITGDANPYSIMLKRGNIHGLFVGDRSMFEQMNQAIEGNGIKPVVDKVFPFEQAAAAYQHQASGNFMGKVVIAI